MPTVSQSLRRRPWALPLFAACLTLACSGNREPEPLPSQTVAQVTPQLQPPPGLAPATEALCAVGRDHDQPARGRGELPELRQELVEVDVVGAHQLRRLGRLGVLLSPELHRVVAAVIAARDLRHPRRARLSLHPPVAGRPVQPRQP